MSVKKTLLLSRPRYADLLREELSARWQLNGDSVTPSAVALPVTARIPPLSQLIFARQALPQAMQLGADSVPAMVDLVIKRIHIMAQRANRQSGRWTLHAFSLNDDEATPFVQKVEKGVLARIKTEIPAWHRRYLDPETLPKADTTQASTEPAMQVLQLYMPDLTNAWLSMAALASGISPWVGGNLRQRERAGFPSRSARKLEEAFLTMQCCPQPGETAVDLGAAPGGWSFTLARYGAHVTAVDHGALATAPTPKLAALVHHEEANGLKYEPAQPVDWLCCDMVIASRETIRVLRRWLEQDWMRHFVINIKLPQAKPWPSIAEAADLLQSCGWSNVQAKHLYHDRREITLMGSRGR